MENTTENLVENEIIESAEVLVENESSAVKGTRGRHATIYNIHSNNTVYMGFLDTLKANTAYQYGLTVQAFLQSLGQKTIKRVNVEELNNFVGDSEVKKTHLKGLYKWAVANNVNGTGDDVQRAVLIWLL